MRRSIDQSVDNATESEQALVDHTSLTCSLVLSSGATDILRTCKVDEVQLADAQEAVASGGSRRGMDGD